MDSDELSKYRVARQKRAILNRQVQKRYWPRYDAQSTNPYWEERRRIIHEIDDVLEEYLGFPLICAEARFGANLIYSDFDGPIWRLGKGKQGKAETRVALQALKDAETVLVEEQVLLGDEQFAFDNLHFRKNIAAYLQCLPAPLNLAFDIDLFSMQRSDLHEIIVFFHDLVMFQSSENLGGNRLAFNASLALRAVFEHYTKKAVTVGKDRSDNRTVVVCVYARCLEVIFEIIGVNAEVYSKANWARHRSEEDPMLLRYRQALIANSSFREGQPYLFSEVGWVENMTPAQKQVNSIAMNNKRLEHLLCYTKCLTEPNSTTTTIKS